MIWNENNTISVTPPKRTKKITGTRFGAVLDQNRWATPFAAWCEITKTYQEPFEDTIYTIAGKTIEPKQQEYMKSAYAMFNLKTPEDIYGEDFFNKTYGDFFPDSRIFGGMWDSILVDKDGKPTAVIEFKTTKRVEDWEENPPEYYSLQASLYAYLLGVEQVYMVASFLEDADYEHPENYKPSADNTIVVPFKLHGKYPHFELLVEQAEKWWDEYVVTGNSPVFDRKKDADIIKALETKFVAPDTDTLSLLEEAETLNGKIKEHEAEFKEIYDRYDAITEELKKRMMKQFTDEINTVEMASDNKVWKLSKSTSVSVDKKALEKDGLLNKYSVARISYRLTNSNKGDK